MQDKVMTRTKNTQYEDQKNQATLGEQHAYRACPKCKKIAPATRREKSGREDSLGQWICRLANGGVCEIGGLY